MMILLTGPLALLCCYLAYRCYRIEYHRHSLVLVGIALFLFLLTAVFVGGSFYAWNTMEMVATVVLN
ncbi:MAG: hypothetical protein C0622_04505 [Desulfuromonas sp.]|nr:MAG: hypothetical protein C0622_04505 [Desulfuromonas sp.]